MKTEINHLGRIPRESLLSRQERRRLRCRAGAAAFSLIEIMVAVGLLTFIILGLLAVFTQTQRAFRTSMTQTDVLEGGRSFMEMMTREISQAVPTKYPGPWWGGVNFFTQEFQTNIAKRLVQQLPGVSAPRPARTNTIQRFFFLTKINQDWVGTGYQLMSEDPNGYVGTLYRFSITNVFRRGPFYAHTAVWTNLAGMSRIAEGIVHLRIRPIAANGFPLYADVVSTNALFRTNSNPYLIGFNAVQDTLAVRNALAEDNMEACYFFKDAVPAAVDLEVGILEPRIFQQYKSIPANLPAAREYLASHVAQVHLFRQRIPLRNADLSVYP